MDGMGASTLKKASSIAVAGNQSPSELIREGSYVTAGETLFSVVSKTAMWIELRLPVSQSGTVSRGDEVEVELGNGATLKSKIDFVQPFFSDGEEFVKARVYANDDNLRIGQLVKATITRTTKETYWLPKQAVIDLGNEKIVFVKEREMFKPKKIVTGVETGSSIEVLQGLVSSDEVAVNAQYIVDSESFIKSK
jgi:hypothetical protein